MPDNGANHDRRTTSTIQYGIGCQSKQLGHKARQMQRRHWWDEEHQPHTDRKGRTDTNQIQWAGLAKGVCSAELLKIVWRRIHKAMECFMEEADRFIEENALVGNFHCPIHFPQLHLWQAAHSILPAGKLRNVRYWLLTVGLWLCRRIGFLS